MSDAAYGRLATMNLADPRLLHDLLEGLPEAFVLADLQGLIRWWNPAAERLFGYTSAEALGASLNLIVPERFRPAHDAGFARAVVSGELRVGGRVMRTRASAKDGRKLYVDFSFALLKDADGAVIGVYATARDATEAHLKASSPS
jgi:PAS domain S-box-containing protein